MKTNNKIKVRYVQELEVSDGLVFPKFSYLPIDHQKSTRYGNASKALFGLSKTAHNLLYYLVDYMSKENVVYSNAFFKSRFNKILYWTFKECAIEKGKSEEQAELEGQNAKYSDSTIRRAYTELKDANVLIPFKNDSQDQTRGVYWVNPVYFWRGTEKKRKEKIKKIMQIQAGTESIIKDLSNKKSK